MNLVAPAPGNDSCNNSKNKSVCRNVQVEIAEAVDQYGKDCCHGSKGKASCLAAAAFELLET